MEIVQAQADLRRAYANGATGVLVSGLVWVGAGLTALFGNLTTAMAVLFFGGMAIHPVATYFEQMVMKRGRASSGNALEKLGLLTVPTLFLGLFAGFLVSVSKPEWFFAVALLGVGARYLVFQTLFGMNHYIALGFALIAIGMAAIFLLPVPAAYPALAGGIAEMIFGFVIRRARSD